MTPAFFSSSRKVVATETLSNTASTATLRAPSTLASSFCYSIGMPSFSYVERISGSSSASEASVGLALGEARSGERRGGKERVCKGRFRGCRNLLKKNNKKKK